MAGALALRLFAHIEWPERQNLLDVSFFGHPSSHGNASLMPPF